MSTFGKVSEVKINTDKKGQSQGFGYVCFEDKAHAKIVIKIHIHSVNNKNVR